MDTARSFWEEVYKRFDPSRPPAEHHWRVNRPYSPRDNINAGLRRPFGSDKPYVVIGTSGTGLSTELLAIAEGHTNQRMVVFFDVYKHFVDTVRDEAAINHVEPWEVLMLVGLAVYRVAEDRLGHSWAAEHIKPFDEAVRGFLRDGEEAGKPVLNIAKLAGTMAIFAGGAAGGTAGAGLALVGKAAQAAQWTFEMGRRSDALPDQDARVGRLRNAVNLLIGTLQSTYQPLLIVVDGLDRIQNEQTTRRLFVDSTLLSGLSCATVVDGPLILRRKGLAAQLRHFEPRVLANVPVLDQQDPRQPGRGTEILREVYGLRVRDLVPASGELGIPDALVERLAYYSGGRMRDFVRLVRMVAEQCWDRDLAVADETAIEACIDERRLVMEMGMDRSDIELLTRVVEDPDHRLPDSDGAAALLDMGRLLPYPNKSVWYFPHPLLTLQMVPIAPPG